MTGAVVLAVLVATGLATMVLPGRLAPLVLIVIACVWPLVNGSLEGPVLWALDPDHGLTATDLLSPLALVIAAARLLRKYRRTPGARSPVSDRD